MRNIAFVGVVFLLACGRGGGGEGGSSASAPVMTVTVEDSGSLPACGESNKSQLIYVTAEQQFQTCDGDAWQAVTLPTTRIRASIHCSGEIPDIPGLWVTYNASRMTTDDIFVSAEVAGSGISVSMAKYYSAQQVGSGNPAVTVVYDVSGTDNAGWWEITLNLDTLITSATYNDNEISGGKQTWTMTADKCTLNNYE